MYIKYLSHIWREREKKIKRRKVIGCDQEGSTDHSMLELGRVSDYLVKSLHFTDGETEIQRRKVTCPRSDAKLTPVQTWSQVQ